MAEVELKNIVKIYDKKKIIDNISLKVKDKEFLVLAGSSGCGKSTMLRMIAGLESITSGEIFIDNKCVNNMHPKDRDIAFVFQNYALYPHMSVYENIAFPLKMRKFSKKDIDEKVRETAAILNLTELLDRKPKQLSGGQRQRTALGRAMVRNPKVFLMDEPLSNLDAKLRVQMRAEIKKLHQRLETTFIYVTHDQTEALTMGDRIAVLNEGRIEQLDSPDEIYNNPANVFTGGFIGSPPMNFIKCPIDKNILNINGSTLVLNENQAEKLEGRKEIILGVRPEHFNRGNADFEFRAKVSLSEMLGNSKTAYFTANDTPCCALLSADAEINGSFRLNSNSILFFDLETGIRI